MKLSSEKCHLILSYNDENKKIEFNREVINNTKIQNLLGANTDYTGKLKFVTHIETLSKKMRKMLHAFALPLL